MRNSIKGLTALALGTGIVLTGTSDSLGGRRYRPSGVQYSQENRNNYSVNNEEIKPKPVQDYTLKESKNPLEKSDKLYNDFMNRERKENPNVLMSILAVPLSFEITKTIISLFEPSKKKK